MLAIKDGTAEPVVIETPPEDELTIYSQQQLITVWEQYFGLSEIASRLVSTIEDKKKFFELNYTELDHYMGLDGQDFLDNVENSPGRAMLAAQRAIQNLYSADVSLRLLNLPKWMRLSASQIRERYIGKLISVVGVIAQDTRVFPFMDDAYFECLRCHATMRVRQDDIIMREPLECSKDDPTLYVGDPGCGRSANSTNFKLLDERVHWRDYQCVMLEESPEDLDDPRRQSCHVEVRLMDDLAGGLIAGDRCVVNGILRTRPRTLKDNTVVREFILDAVGVERYNDNIREDLTAGDIERCHAFAADGNVLERFKDLMATDIYGMDEAKRACALSVIGGVAKKAHGGTHLRGDIHVLLIGDPSTAKSQLVIRAGTLSPRHVLASGKASTGVGLTAAVVKEEFEFGKGRPTLKAGAMPKAHRGTLIIDELDKVSREDISSLHPGMEQQQISVNKWGISATMKCRCNILAAANPKGSRFESFQSIDSQIQFDATILSRFDLIVPIRDVPDSYADNLIYTHMAATHRKASTDIDAEQEKADDTEFLRKYITFAKTIFPRIPLDVDAMLRKFAVEVRLKSQMSDDTGRSSKLSMTHRMFGSLMRMTEASARLNLREVATGEDARCAMERLNAYLTSVAQGDDGSIDIDAIESGGRTGKVRDIEREIVQYIKINTMESGANAPGMYDAKILDYFTSKGYTLDDVQMVLKEMLQTGQLVRAEFNTVNVP